MDDSGLWYQNYYGPGWNVAFSSFATYRKEFPVGQSGWLTASLSARDWDKDGVIEAPPSICTQMQGSKHVAVLDVPDHTGGAIFRSTNKLPPRYRIEYKLKTIVFGGKRDGLIEYDGRVNGYSTEGCKTRHPWGEGSKRPGWTGARRRRTASGRTCVKARTVTTDFTSYPSLTLPVPYRGTTISGTTAGRW